MVAHTRKLGWPILFAALECACCPQGAQADGGSDGSPDGSRAAPFSVVQREILDRTCVTDCHELVNAGAGLRLAAGWSHGDLVDVPSTEVPSEVRVVPGASGASYLMKKLLGAAGISGDQMPRSGSPLSAGDLSRVRTWIDRGALDD